MMLIRCHIVCVKKISPAMNVTPFPDWSDSSDEVDSDSCAVASKKVDSPMKSTAKRAR